MEPEARNSAVGLALEHTHYRAIWCYLQIKYFFIAFFLYHKRLIFIYRCNQKFHVLTHFDQDFYTVFLWIYLPLFRVPTHADCKSKNLIYQLQCTECNAFYVGETRHSLSDHMNGHRFTTTVSNPDVPVAIHTQSHQIFFQECWSVSVMHKLPDSTPDHIRRQFETAYQLVLQFRHTGLNIC